LKLLDDEALSFLTDDERVRYYKAQSEVSALSPKLNFNEPKSKEEIREESKEYERLIKAKLAPFLSIALSRKGKALRPKVTVLGKLKSKFIKYLIILSFIIIFVLMKKILT